MIEDDRRAVVYRGRPPNHCCVDQMLRILPDGDWIVMFMTGGGGEPEIENHIVMSRSTDEGATWDEPEVVLRYEDRACLPSELIVEDNRLLAFVYTHDGGFGCWRCWLIDSDDVGRTWSEPRRLEPYPENTFIRNLCETSWGEWVLPVQTYRPPDGVEERREKLRHGYNGSLISDDRGESWQRSELIGPTPGWVENNIVELSDGRLAMLIRADGTGNLLRSSSSDRGRTWSEPEAADIPNPGSKFRLHRLSDGRICLVHNPAPVTRDPSRRRNPLALWISDDDMRSWGYRRVLTDFPGMLAYPDGVVDHDERFVHFAFDYNRHDVIYWGAAIPPA